MNIAKGGLCPPKSATVVIVVFCVVHIIQQAYSCTNTADITYTIVVRDQCSDTEVTIDSGSIRDHNIPYTVNCTNITIIAENSLGILEHLVNTTSPGELIYN